MTESVTYPCSSPKDRVNLVTVAFNSSDLVGMHTCAIHYLNRSLTDVKELNRPRHTAEGERVLREQILWHRARGAGERQMSLITVAS